MKKNFFAFAAACMIAALGAGAAQAQDLDKNATQDEIAAFEAENFVDFNALDSSSDAKFSASLVAANDEGAKNEDAKCWFWGWRYYTYYPSYYYYSWYCPCHFVNYRLVYYTVPTTVVTTTPTVSQTTITTSGPTVANVTATSASSATAVAIAKSTGQTACGGVIDEIRANSPLAKLGLKVGDVVTSVDGVQVKSMSDLRKIKENSKLTFIPGSQISVSKKAVNHTPNATEAKSLSQEAPLSVSAHQKAFGDKETISLYEYYEALGANK